MNIVKIKKNKINSIERKTPWVFSGAITSDTKDFKDGDVVTVCDPKDHFLARGHYQHATISVRILTFEDEELNQDFFNKRILNAVELRKNLNLFKNLLALFT